jgi:hypothetical protein
MAAKKVTKKTTKKTVAKKAATNKTTLPKAAGSFDLLGAAGKQFAADAVASLQTALGNKKGRLVDCTPQSELIIETLPVRSLQLQWGIDNWGIPKGSTEIVGKDRTGKSTLLYYLFGGFMLANSPCCVMVGENKPIETKWAVRVLSNDARIASAMVDVLLVIKTSNLDEMAEQLRTWASARRDPKDPAYVPMSVPIVVAVDPVGKFTTRSQSAGIAVYDGRDKEKISEIGGQGKNWERAKWLHAWMPIMSEMQRLFNLHTIYVSHQNDANVAGGMAPPSFIPQYSVDLNNRTKPGGNAINQNIGLQLVCAERGFYYSAGVPVGRRIAVRPYKNSYGVEGRIVHYALKGDNFNDREGYIDSGLRWDWSDLEWMAEHGYLGVRKTGATRAQERFSSAELGFTQLSLVDAAEELYRAPQEKFTELGCKLGLTGYVNVYERIMGELGKTPKTLEKALRHAPTVVPAPRAEELPPPGPPTAEELAPPPPTAEELAVTEEAPSEPFAEAVNNEDILAAFESGDLGEGGDV